MGSLLCLCLCLCNDRERVQAALRQLLLVVHLASAVRRFSLPLVARTNVFLVWRQPGVHTIMAVFWLPLGGKHCSLFLCDAFFSFLPPFFYFFLTKKHGNNWGREVGDENGEYSGFYALHLPNQLRHLPSRYSLSLPWTCRPSNISNTGCRQKRLNTKIPPPSQ